jgi:hypothetical protein
MPCIQIYDDQRNQTMFEPDQLVVEPFTRKYVLCQHVSRRSSIISAPLLKALQQRSSLILHN